MFYRRFFLKCWNLKTINKRQLNLDYRIRNNTHQKFLLGSNFSGQNIIKMAHSSSTANKTPNRLTHEKSPYLLQHAYNPVDWYPWGEEAFEKAKKEDKLIFLSVGYSTCHWCHVMERESFENDEIAKVMNEHFINVKVDREERPDVDRVYMNFIHASSGSGGWPMSVFLTPELVPIAGGTYFPPNDRYYGRPGFKTLLLKLSEKWTQDKENIISLGKNIIEVLNKVSKFNEEGVESLPNKDIWRKCFQQFDTNFDNQDGGFSPAPKFPQPSNFNFLFHVYARNRESEEGREALEMCLHTLKKMAHGGIHDHVSQGFARYSTDVRWHVPHFEKMLYDQSQLLISYSNAFIASKDPFFADITQDIVTYVSRDLSHPLGGFYSAEDADSLPKFDSTEKKEGAFCVWTYEEINTLLADKQVNDDVTLAQLFCHHFDVKPEGNVNPYQDPHDELKLQNVLIINGSLEETAEKFNLNLDITKNQLEIAKNILHEARKNRPRPHLDDKMVTAWNGLMISGLSKAYEALNKNEILERAIKAAEFIKKYLYLESEGVLLRSCYQGDNGSVSQLSVPVHGFASDYAFLIRGLIDLYEASTDAKWLEWAEQLQNKQDELFWDQESAGYFADQKSPDIVVRFKEDQDGAEPACNSISASNLLRLSILFEKSDLEEKAKKLLTAYSSRLNKIPMAVPEMSSALLMYHDSPTQVIIAGDLNLESTKNLLKCVRNELLPGRILGFADGNKDGILYKKNEAIRSMHINGNGEPVAYVCRHHTCSLPVNTNEKLLNLLKQPLE